MDKIGWIGLQLNTFRLGNRSVGKMPSTREYVRVITTVNFGGTFVMNEEHALFLLMIGGVVATLALNMVVQGFIG
tara:strand:+ start:76 stop:300 length:225 start_codon:yes stop_codon:yes gene_type:complete